MRTGRSLDCGEELVQGVRFDWFDDVVIKAGVVGAAPILFLAPAGERDENDTGQTGLFAQAPRYFVAVHHGHANVQKDDLRLEGPRLVECRRPLEGDMYVAALHSEEQGEALGGIPIVVDDQNTVATGGH